MSTLIENPTKWEVCALIRFLVAKILSTAGIYHELCTAYVQNIMREGVVHQWVQSSTAKVEGHRTNINDELHMAIKWKLQKINQYNLMWFLQI